MFIGAVRSALHFEQNGIGPNYGTVEFTLIKNENRKRKQITGFKNGKLATFSEKGALQKKGTVRTH